MAMLKKLLLNLKWTVGYRAVFMKEPSDRQLIVYAKMGRAVAGKHCAVCHGEYWVIGNPKIKGHFSPVCGRRKCYLEYYLHPEKHQPARATRRQPSDKVKLIRPTMVKSKRNSEKFSRNKPFLAENKA